MVAQGYEDTYAQGEQTTWREAGTVTDGEQNTLSFTIPYIVREQTI